MERTFFEEKCKELFALNADLIPEPTDSQIASLYHLTSHMLKVNEQMNLTAITDPEGIILKHYIDSLTISASIPSGAKLLDVGCGAGFPTLPLAIFRPDISITALDSTGKRINYLNSTAELLCLGNVLGVTARAEEHAKKPEYRECFDVVTARAVAALPVLCELCLPFVKVGGAFIAMKAAKGEDELDAAKNAIGLCGGRVRRSELIELCSAQGTPEPRRIITIDKVSRTPSGYPRHYSAISKKPL